ncbi:MAG: prepilin-type N-terminal cleavage/methylation domain-containing protein [Nitrosomonadales bacterium]|nr:prepilin-type N-terminal cleavage/methylation domain-containing protein [Nitrosomonadales bacterium]
MGVVKNRGFTLIELLVVLVITGIALGVAVVQLMPDDRATLREEAQRLALLLENAGMEARASGRPLAWSAENDGYRFWKKNDYGDWVGLDDDAIFRPRSLPAGLHIAEVSVEAQALKPGAQMPLSAWSFAPPFSIRMHGEHASANIAGSSTGAVSARLDGESSDAKTN